MGYHQRTEFNKKVIKVGTEGAEITPKGGFLNYGEVRNTYVLIHGSVPGPTKRPIRIRDATTLPKGQQPRQSTSPMCRPSPSRGHELNDNH